MVIYWVLRFVSRINVEPVIFLFSIVFGISTTIKPLVLYWALCIEIFMDPKNVGILEFLLILAFLYYSVFISNTSVYLNIVERNVSALIIYSKVIGCIPILITSPIIGTWSDNYGGRRRPLLLALFGLFIYTTSELLIASIFEFINIYYIEISAQILVGCCGGATAIFSSAFSAVSDHWHISISILYVLFALSIFNLHVYFLILQRLYNILLAYTSSHDAIVDDRISVASSGTCSKIKDFSLESVEILFKRRRGWTRFCLNLSLCIVFIEFLSTDNQLIFLLTKRPPFSWSDSLFSNYSLIKNLLFSLGIICVPLVLSKINFFGKDSALIIIGVLANSLSYLTFISILFSGALFSFITGCISLGFRSFLPSLVTESETARLYTASGIILIICPSLNALIFNNIFNATIDFWPGFVFLIGAILQMVVVLAQILIHCLMRQQWNKESEDEDIFFASDDIHC
ncbi:unnamed protein product [Dracunculus medinensis]|uniref:MFS domain-containing protein n=1 Tax=Dracunculus medinensis TaxID=318479 RepID=A0A0N4ULR8_DRAME|nr:unnamed protein product [Dracunculus medinensis]